MTDPDIASPRRSYGSSWIAVLVAGLVVVLVVIGLVVIGLRDTSNQTHQRLGFVQATGTATRECL
jgi:hypothetical protein